VPTTSPLRVDEGGFYRRHPTREPVAVAASSFFRSTSAAGGVTSGVVLDGCVGCRDSLSLSEFSLFEFLKSELKKIINKRETYNTIPANTFFYECDYIDLAPFVKTWNWLFQKSKFSKC
jgi:hypothetical protein